MTCHNRKAMTIECIKSVYNALKNSDHDIHTDIYLTDDGSSDGTAAEINKLFPDVIITRGDGNLYWAGGMSKSWKVACEKSYHGFLLLNDDTILFSNALDEIIKTHDYCQKKYARGGVYVGSVKDPESNEDSYGGSILRSRVLFTLDRIMPNGKIQECHVGNGNVMFVSKSVFDSIGIFKSIYKHGIADYDYTLRARRAGFAVLVCAEYCGYCERDHAPDDFSETTLKERIGMLNRPRGIEAFPYLYFMYKFFPYRLPLVLGGTILRLLAPKGLKGLNRAIKR